MSSKAFSSRRSSLNLTFVESYVDFEVAHLSVLMVRSLAYPKIPTLTELDNDISECSHACNTGVTDKVQQTGVRSVNHSLS